MRGSLIAAAIVAILLIAVTVAFVRRPSPGETSSPELAAQNADAVPTPQYLFAHPDMLTEAEQKCHDNSASSSLYCSNVHKAESLRLADQYRHGLKSSGAAP
jgi:hypothetical protein